MDLGSNVLVVKAASNVDPWPAKLVYSADQYEFTWQFNPERTLQQNSAVKTLPFPAGVTAEFTVVVAPASLSDVPFPTLERNDAVLALEGATIAKTLRVSVDAVARKVVQGKIQLPGGDQTHVAFDVQGAWSEPDEDIIAVYLRPLPLVLSQGVAVLRFDEVKYLQASGYAGGSRVVYLKVMRKGP